MADMTLPALPEESFQRVLCVVAGVKHLTVLEHPDGVLVYGLDLRRDICREIRRFKPDVVLGTGYEIETPYGFDQADHRAAWLEAHAAYLAALPGHPAPGDIIPKFTAMSGKAMGVEHAVLFRAHDLQAPPEFFTEAMQD